MHCHQSCCKNNLKSKHTIAMISSINKLNAGTSICCNGFHSCSNVNPLLVTSGDILTNGANVL